MDNIQYERRESKGRTFERSFSYSAAIGNVSERSSIEIPTMTNTEVYTNEDLRKHRISQTYVEGKEIVFPYIVTNIDTENCDATKLDREYSSQYSSEDENTDGGLVMTIDIETESPRSSEKRNISDASTQPVVGSVNSTDIYDTIEMAESIDNDTDTMPTVYDYSSQYTKRRKKSKRTRRQPGRPMRSRRVVYKSGEENVPVRSNIPAKSMKYMRDMVNTVINSKWRFIILMMVCSYFLFWFIFAGIWYAVTSSYKDDIGDGKDHCVTGTSSFAGLLMMAVETQMTIGYGVRYPNEECPEAIIVMVFEIIAGTALSGGLAGLLFTKMVRPNRQGATIGFSKKATVCLRDGELCLQFRVWDLLNVHLIGSTISAYMLKPIRTLEGEKVQNYIHQLELKEGRAFLLWPITVVHVINHESPLYDLSAQDMMDFRFEIVVCLTGSSKNMGTVTQSRTSYLSKEIIWGYRFKNVLHWSKKHEAFTIDVENLDSVEQVETPLCSACQLKEFEEDIKSSRQLLSSPTNLSFTRISLNQEDTSTFSRVGESVPSSPTTNMNMIRRSFGWRFRRFFPERYVEIQNRGLVKAGEL
ncbi:G protein-activated inward rectifier potassium channel 3-like [Maniola hyperantus]|uniref:G protein-activated inward rectifier potassium channel 3-like n=1 Tax=Aphantopus hyperantus TaxID=2795564 RepID=UPI00156A26AE|nr:ATP-sensitive inward rectifier potassium channel 1-like isoform X1 [Maniola hyperantus]